MTGHEIVLDPKKSQNSATSLKFRRRHCIGHTLCTPKIGNETIARRRHAFGDDDDGQQSFKIHRMHVIPLPNDTGRRDESGLFISKRYNLACESTQLANIKCRSGDLDVNEPVLWSPGSFLTRNYFRNRILDHPYFRVCVHIARISFFKWRFLIPKTIVRNQCRLWRWLESCGTVKLANVFEDNWKNLTYSNCAVWNWGKVMCVWRLC